MQVMRELGRRLLPVLGVVVLAGCEKATEIQESADIVFQNGAVYTVNPEQEWAEAVAVKGGKIAAVGGDEIAEFGWPLDVEAVLDFGQDVVHAPRTVSGMQVSVTRLNP